MSADQAGQYFSELRDVIGAFTGPKREEILYLVYRPATAPAARVQRPALMEIWSNQWNPVYKGTVVVNFSGEVRRWLARLLTGSEGYLEPIEDEAIKAASARGSGSFVVQVHDVGDGVYRIRQVHRRVPKK